MIHSDRVSPRQDIWILRSFISWFPEVHLDYDLGFCLFYAWTFHFCLTGSYLHFVIVHVNDMTESWLITYNLLLQVAWQGISFLTTFSCNYSKFDDRKILILSDRIFLYSFKLCDRKSDYRQPISSNCVTGNLITDSLFLQTAWQEIWLPTAYSFKLCDRKSDYRQPISSNCVTENLITDSLFLQASDRKSDYRQPIPSNCVTENLITDSLLLQMHDSKLN